MNVLDLECQMAEVPAFAVLLRIPVVGELDRRFLLARRRNEDKGEAALLALIAPGFDQPQLVAVEVK